VTIPNDILTRLPPVDYDVLRPQMRTGDLLLCQGEEAFSKLIRWATRSPWSHIALVARIEEFDRVMALESVEKIGVRTVPVSRFISQDSAGQSPYPGRILLARHRRFAELVAEARLRAMTRLAFERFGTPFGGGETAKIALRLVAGGLGLRIPKPLQPRDEYICSEYVDRCYRQVGIETPWNRDGFIGPSDFAADPEVEAVAQVQTR
jgi:hypothetical protein